MKTLKTVYETTDGKMWKDKGQAKHHEAWLDLVALCALIADELLEDVANGVTTNVAADMAKLLLAEAKELARILRAGPIDGGGDIEATDSTPEAKPCECGRRSVEPDEDLCSLCLEETTRGHS